MTNVWNFLCLFIIFVIHLFIMQLYLHTCSYYIPACGPVMNCPLIQGVPCLSPRPAEIGSTTHCDPRRDRAVLDGWMCTFIDADVGGKIKTITLQKNKKDCEYLI